MAKSACTHSARLADTMPTASPRRRPPPPAAAPRQEPPGPARAAPQRHEPGGDLPHRLAHLAPGQRLPRAPALELLRGSRRALLDPVPEYACQRSVRHRASPSRLCADLAPKLFPEDLAHRALRQGVHEADLFRALVLGESALAERDDLVGRRGLPGPEHDEREDLLAHERVRHSDHGGLGGLGEGVERLLDIPRIDVEAAADDEVLLALHNVEKVLGVEPAHVPRAEPPAADRPRRLLRIPAVAPHHVRALHANFAHLAGWQGAVAVVPD